MFATSPSPIMDSITLGGRPKAARPPLWNRPKAASIMGDKQIHVNICVFAHLAYFRVFPIVGPWSYSICETRILAHGKEMMYTQNSLCRQNYCTNPIFPGINDLPRLEALQWQLGIALKSFSR